MIKHLVLEPERLEEIIKRYYPEMQGVDRKQLFRRGLVKLDGQIIKKDCETRTGQTAEFYGELMLPEFAPQTQVVYEDDNLIVFNKQQGISVVQQKGKHSLLEIAEEYMRGQGSYSIEARCVPIVCNSMDAETGGLVIIAKNEQFYEEIIAALHQRRIRRFYRCIVKGTPQEQRGEFHDFIIQDIKNNKAKVVPALVKDSAPAVTRYETINADRSMSLLEAEPITGRLHQICAQFAYHGIPVAGDERYGDKKFNKRNGIYYQALWLHKLFFEVGRNNILGYLNDKVIQTQDVSFPYTRFGK